MKALFVNIALICSTLFDLFSQVVLQTTASFVQGKLPKLGNITPETEIHGRYCISTLDGGYKPSDSLAKIPSLINTQSSYLAMDQYL